MGGKLSCRGAVRRELVLFCADCAFAAFRRPAEPADQHPDHTDHKWPDRVVFDTSRWRLAPAENAQAETEATRSKPSQTPNPVDWHDPVEAFAEWDVTLSKTVSGLGVSRAAKALTAPNPFHKLPGKN
jgi:hypothetical protein